MSAAIHSPRQQATAVGYDLQLIASRTERDVVNTHEGGHHDTTDP
jgi:hypothetical protein